MRRAHWLRRNKASSLPHLAIWTDTETLQERVNPSTVRHVLDFGWACYQRTLPDGSWSAPSWLRYETPYEFWDWVESLARPKTKVYLYAHNWGFDAPVLRTFEVLPERNWRMKTAIVECPPVILKWVSDRKSIVMLDTLNWFRTSLKALGESIGSEKLPMPSRQASRAEWDAYCRQDVETIRVATHKWWKFLATYDLGAHAPTLAGQAFGAFRHRFMTSDILVDDNPLALEIARKAYRGGRVEAYQLGRIDGPIEHFDVNSMYPHVMRDCEYPTILRLAARCVELSELREWLARFAVCADVDLDTNEPAYHATIDGRLCFPVGRFRSHLTTPELTYALEKGHITKVHSAALYDKANLFREFVDVLYALRRDAKERQNDVDAWLLKIMMNSLYGKFGQNGMVWANVDTTDDRTIARWSEVDADTGIVYAWRKFSGLIQRKDLVPESRESCPAIAAHVTAYARMLLYRLCLQAGPAEVYYVDTDSIFCSSRGARRLAEHVDAVALGKLKHEGTHPWMTIHGAKDYQTEKGRVLKGVRPSAEWLSANTTRQEEWSSIGGLIERGDLSAPTTTQRLKTQQRKYTKGYVDGSGRVHPFRLTLPR